MPARRRDLPTASRSTCAPPRSATLRSGCKDSAKPLWPVRSRPSCCALPASSASRVFPRAAVLNPPVHERVAAMMSDADRKKAADILVAAEKDRKQAMQRSSQIDEPDYGHLLDCMMIADGARIPHENYCLPRVEIELAFILGKPLRGPGVGLPEVLRATEYVVPAIEIVDARLQDPRKIFDTVSDNGAAAGIVIGGRPVGPLEVDLRWVGGVMYRNSEIEETGVAAGVLGHPALGVAWLANKLGQHGVSLDVGHLVLAGSFTRVVFARKGDTLHADFGALGGIAVQFV